MATPSDDHTADSLQSEDEGQLSSSLTLPAQPSEGESNVERQIQIPENSEPSGAEGDATSYTGDLVNEASGFSDHRSSILHLIDNDKDTPDPPPLPLPKPPISLSVMQLDPMSGIEGMPLQHLGSPKESSRHGVSQAKYVVEGSSSVKLLHVETAVANIPSAGDALLHNSQVTSLPRVSSASPLPSIRQESLKQESLRQELAETPIRREGSDSSGISIAYREPPEMNEMQDYSVPMHILNDAAKLPEGWNQIGSGSLSSKPSFGSSVQQQMPSQPLSLQPPLPPMTHGALPFIERHAPLPPPPRRGTTNSNATANAPIKTSNKILSSSGRSNHEAVLQDLNSAAMQDLFTVRGLRENQSHPISQLQHKGKGKISGRINFRNMFGPPANTGGGTLPPSKIKEGLRRRAAAADMMVNGPSAFSRKAIPRPPSPEGFKLDGFMMLEAGDEELPENVSAAKLAHKNINEVEIPDMSYFPSLRILDLSDNKVPGIDVLSGLSGLQQLIVTSNRLVDLGSSLAPGAFQELAFLDLSYNLLHATDVLGSGSPLSELPRLTELDLSGNSLTHLSDAPGTFPALQVLRLNENRLSGSALASLAALPELRELFLSHNVVTAVYDDVTEIGSFPQLQVLDLTNNRIVDEQAIGTLHLLPNLQILLLAGNPIAIKQKIAEKKTERMIGPVDHIQGNLKIHFKPFSELPPKATIAAILAVHTYKISDSMDPRSAVKAASDAAVTQAASDEQLAEAFDRVDNAIDAWQLNTVDEEEEEEDVDAEEDNTFLTGIGLEERKKRSHTKQNQEMEHQPENVPVKQHERELWEDVEDPTERLALALGLDPHQLAVHTGKLTTDSVGSVNALRFALNHPLVQADEGLLPPQHHLGMTVAARAKRRERKLAPLKPYVAPPPDIKTVRIHTMEGMLQGMKERLQGLEASLADKLAAVPATTYALALPGQKGKQDKSNEIPGFDGEDLDIYDPDTQLGPPSPNTTGPQLELSMDRKLPLEDDACSEMSALPDDVIDAIENPDLSDPEEDDFINEVTAGEEVEDALTGEGQSQTLAICAPPITPLRAGAGPAAAVAATTSKKGANAGFTSGASNALGYS